ncbi:Chemotaxis protein CheV [Arenibacter antarcticus]|uniref:Response regulator n=1 Tax=Arenibacter antarcticus TaxID=2040469 RepID=A0ABW5VE35_9FLAO|nr:response regulator [Arenibacter sp. H213]MCM4167681.1 response regulator [Arenibacter sp. H213]
MKTIKQACIIDDDTIFVFGIKIMLKKNNYCSNVVVYKNGKEALENMVLANSTITNLPDLIFLDINMPVMDGWEFLDEFSKFPKASEVAIFVLSSSIDARDLERAKSYEVVRDFIEKPLSNTKLKNLIHQLETDDSRL